MKEQIVDLETYLDEIVGLKLFNDKQLELSNIIIQEISGIKGKYRTRGKKLNPSTLEKIIREELNLEYAISDIQQETTGENRKKRYIIITKLNK